MTLDPQHQNAMGHPSVRQLSMISSSVCRLGHPSNVRSRKRETDMRSFVPVRSFPPEISNVPLSNSSVDFCLRCCTAASSTTEAEAECASETASERNICPGRSCPRIGESRDIYLPRVPAKFLEKTVLASIIHPALSK